MERFTISTMLALVASALLAPAVAWAEAGTIEGTVAHARGNANLVLSHYSVRSRTAVFR